MRSCWKTHKGSKFLYSDYTGFGTDAKALAGEVTHSEMLTLSQANGSVLNLVNVEGSVGTNENVEILKKSAIATKHKTRRIAVLGISGLKALLADGIARISGQTIRYFKTEEEALEWLLREEPGQSD